MATSSLPITGSISINNGNISGGNQYWSSLANGINNGSSQVVVYTGTGPSSNPFVPGIPISIQYGIDPNSLQPNPATINNPFFADSSTLGFIDPQSGVWTPASLGVTDSSGNIIPGISVTSTGTKNAFNVNFPNPASEGTVQGVIGINSSGNILPINNLQQQFAYTPGQSGGFFQSGFGSFLTSVIPLALAAAGIPTAGAAVMDALGATGTAVTLGTGAINGAINSALSGGNAGSGALAGLATSVIKCAANTLTCNSLSSSPVASALTNSAANATKAAITGGNAGQAALTGAVSSAAPSVAQSINSTASSLANDVSGGLSSLASNTSTPIPAIVVSSNPDTSQAVVQDASGATSVVSTPTPVSINSTVSVDPSTNTAIPSNTDATATSNSTSNTAPSSSLASTDTGSQANAVLPSGALSQAVEPSATPVTTPAPADTQAPTGGLTSVSAPAATPVVTPSTPAATTTTPPDTSGALSQAVAPSATPTTTPVAAPADTSSQSGGLPPATTTVQATVVASSPSTNQALVQDQSGATALVTTPTPVSINTVVTVDPATNSVVTTPPADTSSTGALPSGAVLNSEAANALCQSGLLPSVVQANSSNVPAPATVSLGTAPLGTSTGGTSTTIGNVLPTNLPSDAGATATVTPSGSGLPTVTVPDSAGALASVTTPTPTTSGTANIPVPTGAIMPPSANENALLNLTQPSYSTAVSVPQVSQTQAAAGFDQALQAAGLPVSASTPTTDQGIGATTGSATTAAENAGFNQALLNAGMSQTALDIAGLSPLNNSSLLTTGSMAGCNVLGAGCYSGSFSGSSGSGSYGSSTKSTSSKNSSTSTPWLSCNSWIHQIGSGELFNPLKIAGKSTTQDTGAQPNIAAIQSQLIPELANVMYARMGGAIKHMATGSSVCNSYCLSPSIFAPTSPSAMMGATGITRTKAAPLAGLHQIENQIAPNWHYGAGCWALSDPTQTVSPALANTSLAHGGLPHKYASAAPKGHNPEFITGLTGYYASGHGTGQSDDIPAMLHDGDYVIDADAVSALGDGSSKAGAQSLDHLRQNVPHHHSDGGRAVPAQIADGEYVFPASFVTALGGGDNKAGAKMLDKMREELRKHKRSAPDSKIPPKALSPIEYLKKA